MPEQTIMPARPESPRDTVALGRMSVFSELRRQVRHYLLLIALMVVLGALMLYPLYQEIAVAFIDKGKFSFYWFFNVLADATFRSQLLTSLALGLTVTILCNLIAFPLAIIGARMDFRGKGLLSALVLVPMVLPPFVGAIGMKQLLGTFGSLTVFLQHLHILGPHEGVNWLGHGGFWALAVLISLGLYPIAYLNLQAALANIDPAMLEAAQNLGGRRFTNFRRITLPLAMPGIFAGSTIIFIWAFTELGTPLLLDYRNVVSRSIWDDLAQTLSSENSRVFAKVVLVLLVSISAYVVGKITLGRTSYAMTSKAATGLALRRLPFFKGLLAAAPFVVVTLLAVLPHIAVILYSFTAIANEANSAGWGRADVFGWYRTVIPSRYTLEGFYAVFGRPEIYQSILNSIKYAGIATALNMVLGVSIAWVVVRTRVRGRLALDSLAMLPLAVPGLVMAFSFVAILRQYNLRWIIESSPIYILVIAYMVRRMPYLVRSAAGGLQQTSVTLEEAAANLGASPARVLWKITIPLILANLIAGGILTFSFSMLEVSDSLILAQYTQHFPITKMIYVLGSDTSGPTNVRDACSLGVLAMLFLIVTMVSAGLLMGKKLGAIFRAT